MTERGFVVVWLCMKRGKEVTFGGSEKVLFSLVGLPPVWNFLRLSLPNPAVTLVQDHNVNYYMQGQTASSPPSCHLDPLILISWSTPWHFVVVLVSENAMHAWLAWKKDNERPHQAESLYHISNHAQGYCTFSPRIYLYHMNYWKGKHPPLPHTCIHLPSHSLCSFYLPQLITPK